MTALVSVETVLLVLLLVLVAGLLRSHAEILRRLGPAGEARGEAESRATGVGVAGRRRLSDRGGQPSCHAGGLLAGVGCMEA